jgi:UDP-N-acetylmuramoyl-L-alanyl-D-glutamate--2,6-diaminopimelate ligase
MPEQMPTTLAHVLAGAGSSVVNGNPDVIISSIAVDSRRVEPGALFVCLRGAHADGHDYAAQAVAAGASAVLAERPVSLTPNATVAIVENTLLALSPVAAALYGRPSESLIVVGVTGTNGKTTATHFLEAIAHTAGVPFGLIGTLGARLRDAFDEPLEHTTPFAHELARLLARFRDEGARGAVLEVSSHGLALHRVDDIAFDVATFTNLTQDHMDFHASFEEYRDVKRKLFDLMARSSKRPGVGVVNVDDPEGAAISRIVPRCFTFGVDNDGALFNATDVQLGTHGSTFHVKSLRPAPFSVRLPGPFNVSNAMAAIASAAALDFDVEAIAEGLDSVTEVPGRMTRVAAGDVAVYVDYAHTPDGLRKVLESARAVTKNKLICVFGCGGDRDPYKRPLMGAIARELSDLAIITSDNPRFEEPEKIIADVLAGVTGSGGGAFEVVPDRLDAIERAVASARAGDVVVIAGKGHEAFQLVRGDKLPFSDAAAAQAAIAKTRV